MLNLGQLGRILCSQTLGTNMLKLIGFVPRVGLHRMLLSCAKVSKLSLKTMMCWAYKMPELGGD